MPIITISRGSYSRGKEIAEKVANRLGYQCIARETLLEASEQYNIPEAKLVRAVHDAPSVIDHILYGKEKYVAYIQAALVRHVHQDNVVYHGLAGHFLLKGISHVLKVRIIAELEDRIAVVMERDSVNRKEALRVLANDDEQRRKWSKHLYGIDTSDPSLYDIVLHIMKITVDDAVDIIDHAARLKHFQKTAGSQKAIDDLLLASLVKAKLVDHRPNVEVSADDGTAVVSTVGDLGEAKRLADEMKRLAGNIPGLKDLRVDVIPPTVYR